MRNWLIGQAVAFVIVMLFGCAIKLLVYYDFALWPLMVGFLFAFLIQALAIRHRIENEKL